MTSMQTIKETLDALSESQKVEQVTMKDLRHWIYDGDTLKHVSGGYFAVIGLCSSGENDGLIMDQRETGLIGLLVYKRGDEIHFLLQYRCEPGLAKGCNLTTTIQATPSNYLGRHGGKNTFGTDIFLQSNSKHRIVYDSFDYDYGAFFLGKIKRFVVVELDEYIDPPEGFVWISEYLIRSAVFEDYIISTDLRMMIGKYFSLLSCGDPVKTGNSITLNLPMQYKKRDSYQARIDNLRNVLVTDSGFIQSPHSLTPVSEVKLVLTKSLTREIGEWTQPLLTLNCVPVVSLHRARFGGEGYSLCRLRFEQGIFSGPIIGPTYVNYLDGLNSEINFREEIIKEREVLVSGEGARFLQTDFRLELYTHLDKREIISPDGYVWIKDVEMKRLASSSMLTSVELRYCLSLV